MSRNAVFEASLAYFLEPIGRFLEDESVTEIMVNGPDRIFIERRGKLEQVPARFEDEDALLSAIHNLTQYVGRDISPEQPILDARLPSGSRVHAVIPPASRTGPCLTIRKFRPDVLSLNDVVRLGTLSAAAREFLEICIRLRKRHRGGGQRRGENFASRRARRGDPRRRADSDYRGHDRAATEAAARRAA